MCEGTRQASQNKHAHISDDLNDVGARGSGRLAGGHGGGQQHHQRQQRHNSVSYVRPRGD
eukprot:SAG11_NODE_13049_length_671_cov_1.181501_1_plen_59_part_10